MKVFIFTMVSVFLLAALTTAPVLSADCYWIGTDGQDFMDSSKWNPQIPTVGDRMLIANGISNNPGGPVFDYTLAPWTVGDATSGNNVLGNSVSGGKFTMQNGNLTFIKEIRCGLNRYFDFIVNGGTLVHGAPGGLAEFRIGQQSSGDGTLTVNGGLFERYGSLLVAVGNGAKGAVVINGGTLLHADNTTYTNVGHGANSTATFSINGGLFDNKGSLTVGAASGSKGTVTINNGNLEQAGPIVLGYADSSEGTLIVNGGTLFQAGYTYINVGQGANSKGWFYLNDGTFDTTSYITIAAGAGSEGRVFLNGGEITDPWTITVGNAGNAYWTQTGGTVNHPRASMFIGGADGTDAGVTYFDISNGSIIGNSTYFGPGMNWAGTTATALGRAIANISGGLIECTTGNWLQVGGRKGNGNGTAIVTQTGGNVKAGKLEFWWGWWKLQGGSLYGTDDVIYTLNFRDRCSMDFAGGTLYSKYDQTDFIMLWIKGSTSTNGYYEPTDPYKIPVGKKMYTSLPGKRVLYVYGPNQAPDYPGQDFMKVWAGDPAVLVNNDDLFTTSPTVNLKFNPISGDPSKAVFQVRISEDGNFDTEPWLIYSPTMTYTFSDTTPGMKTICVQFMDEDGNISPTSDGVIGPTTFYYDEIGLFDSNATTTTISEAKQMIPEPDLFTCNTKITIPKAKVVFKNYNDSFFYIEDPETPIGIKVKPSTYPPVDFPTEYGEVAVQGCVGMLDGEKVIFDAIVAIGNQTERSSTFMVLDDVGGGDFYYDSNTLAGQKGVNNGVGLNNIGALIKVTGIVKSVNTPSFIINDGSIDVECMVKPGLTVDSSLEGKYVTVTGVSSTKEDGVGGLDRLVLIENLYDIVTVPQP